MTVGLAVPAPVLVPPGPVQGSAKPDRHDSSQQCSPHLQQGSPDPQQGSPDPQQGFSDPQRGFAVKLDVFEGPFDLLLSLVARRKLDLTEVALATVTDDFLAYLHERGPQWDLDTASDFLLVAATLLDLKTARLLPAPPPSEAEDLELLEARDLLYARLLQYAAYKSAAGQLAHRLGEQSRCYPRDVPLEPTLAALLPEVVLGLDVAQFARLAVRALSPPPAATPPQVSLTHLHGYPVDVGEQAVLLAHRLRDSPAATFRALIADSTSPAVVVARFLALLDLYRASRVAFDQATALGELNVRWTGADPVPPVAGTGAEPPPAATAADAPR